jgi:(S)-ureidoglycine aminohydrolase
VQQLGHTRSARALDHLLQTPDTFVRAPLPGMRNANAIVHASPALGAAFTQYTAEIAEGGALGLTDTQRFLYVLEGHLTIDGATLGPGGYAYSAPLTHAPVTTVGGASVAVFEKPYQPLAITLAPAAMHGHEVSVAATTLNGDAGIEVRALVPDDPGFDFRVNTMTYLPGAALPAVEIHVMEHGLLMLEGGGIYRLGNCWYPVTAGDFIWMAPHCPQWFGALGKQPAKYLIYKDWDRHPLAPRHGDLAIESQANGEDGR